MYKTLLRKPALLAAFLGSWRQHHGVCALSSSASSPNSNSCSSAATEGRLGFDYPELVVFDLDACLWDKEMFEMPALPTPDNVVQGDLLGHGQGTTGVYSGAREIISLHRGALIALQEHAHNTYPGMKVALASSANTPFAEQIARASLKLLEVIPGTTVWDLIVTRDWNDEDIHQIGRQPPLLSPNKAKSHFPRIHQLTGIRYDKMLFFDDCNWGDHCGMVEAACKEKDTGKGVTTYRTPNGLGEAEWRKGMERYGKLHSTNDN